MENDEEKLLESKKEETAPEAEVQTPENKEPVIETIESAKEVDEIPVDNSIKPKVNHQLSSSFLKTIIENRNTNILNVTVTSYDPVNVAHALEDLNQEDLLFFFKSVKSDASAEVFTYLEQENQERVVQAFTSKELHAIVDEMATDDLVDFVDDLPTNLIEKVLKAASPEDRAQVKAYLNFADDTAASLMTPEYLCVKDSDSVKTAVNLIRTTGQDKETIWEIFVLDDTRKLVGTVTLDVLLEANEDEVMSELMKKDFVSVNAKLDQAIVLQAFRKYDVSVIPVTNSAQRLLGIITFDDALDVSTEETTEDIQITSGVIKSDRPYMKTNALSLVKSYAIWLGILLILDTFTSMVTSYLSAPLSLIPVLTAFIPTIMGTNGNAADQTATVTMREMALGNISTSNYFKAAFKELRAALITAAIVAIVSFGWMLVELYTGMVSLTSVDNTVLSSFYSGNQNLMFVSISLLISITFFVTITLAKMLGITLPVLAKVVHLDPAVMSSPLISSILDILSVCVYFVFCNLIMKGL